MVKKSIEKCPDAIVPFTKMSHPNEEIKIFEGRYSFNTGSLNLIINGEIKLQWFPSPSVGFAGIVDIASSEFGKVMFELSQHSKGTLIIDSIRIGEGFILSANSDDVLSLRGTASGPITTGDKTVEINKVQFSIVNMREFDGVCVSRGKLKRFDRLEFQDSGYSVFLDKVDAFKSTIETLRKEGGYAITYNGIIQKNDQSQFSHSDAKNVLNRLRWYLCLLSGSFVGIVMINGVFERDIIWTDPGFTRVSLFDYRASWAPKREYSSISSLYQNFIRLWKLNESNLLITLISWYAQINKNDGYSHSKLVMCQASLELCYNWLLIETNTLLFGEDRYKISASNKIRLLLNQLKESATKTIGGDEIENLLANEVTLHDVPEVIVYIRNAIIHSNLQKRTKIADLNSILKFQTLEFGKKYLELSILYILDYKGKYVNRLSPQMWEMAAVEDVPWV